MQEEVENRTLTLVVSGTKFTGRLLKAAISKYMAHCKEKKLQKQRSRGVSQEHHGFFSFAASSPADPASTAYTMLFSLFPVSPAPLDAIQACK